MTAPVAWDETDGSAMPAEIMEAAHDPDTAMVGAQRHPIRLASAVVGHA